MQSALAVPIQRIDMFASGLGPSLDLSLCRKTESKSRLADCAVRRRPDKIFLFFETFASRRLRQASSLRLSYIVKVKQARQSSSANGVTAPSCNRRYAAYVERYEYAGTVCKYAEGEGSAVWNEARRDRVSIQAIPSRKKIVRRFRSIV